MNFKTNQVKMTQNVKHIGDIIPTLVETDNVECVSY